MSVNGSLDDLRGLPEQDIATFLNSVGSEYLIENNERGELARWGWGVPAANIELTPDQREKIQHAYINYDMRPDRPRTGRRSARVVPMGRGLTKKKSKKQSKKSKRRNKGKKNSVRKGKKSARKTRKRQSRLGGYDIDQLGDDIDYFIEECIAAVDDAQLVFGSHSRQLSDFYEEVRNHLRDLQDRTDNKERLEYLIDLNENANKHSHDRVKTEIINIIKGRDGYDVHLEGKPLINFLQKMKAISIEHNLIGQNTLRQGRGKKKIAKKGKKGSRKTRKR